MGQPGEFSMKVVTTPPGDKIGDRPGFEASER